MTAMPAAGQLADTRPEDSRDVDVKEALDSQVPMDATFTDSSGKQVKLGDFFDGTRPVILTMNYSNCPMLCSLQLNGLFQALGKLDWAIGQNFQMITVSIDPKETSERAQSTKEKYLKIYDRPGIEGAWHFLTGTKQNIDKLASSVGFVYKYLPDKNQYAHVAVVMVCTPDGRVSRYLYNVTFDPDTVRTALLEAGEGKIGNTVDRLLLVCYQYDPRSGSYVPATKNIMRIAGALIMLLLGGLIGGLVLLRRRRGHKGAAEPAETAAEPEAAESPTEPEPRTEP